MGQIHSGPFASNKRVPAGTLSPGGTLTCAVSKRVPRLYMEHGKEIERSLRLL